jgi:cytochrome P450
MIETYPETVVRSKPVKRIPQTKGLPLVGSIPDLMKDPFGFLAQARETHGDIYRLNLGLTNVVMLNHPAQIQQVFVDNAQNYRKGGAMWDAIRVLLGNGLVVSEGDFWRRQRRMMQPQFHRQRLAGLTDLMVSAINESLDSWETQETENAFDLAPAFNNLTMKVITRTLFGMGLNAGAMDEVSEAVTYAVDYILKAVALNALPAWMPAPGRRQYQKAIATIDRQVYGIIASARQKAGAENYLLEMLLDSVDAETGEGMTDQQLRDEVTTLFLAGYETTSLTLSWAFDYLVHHPGMMQKIQAEVDSVLGNRPPTFEDLPKLTYTRMVLQETLRLRPSAWQVMRTAIDDDEIDGYPIPAGTNLVALIYMCHHHPAEWPNPEEFDPERFSPENSERRHKLAWMPFGAGKRMCIGKDFALMEGQLALAMTAQRYQMMPTVEPQARPQLSATLRPEGGVKVKLLKRIENKPGIESDAREMA